MNVIDAIQFMSAVIGILGFFWGIVRFFSDEQRHKQAIVASALLVAICCVVFLATHFSSHDTENPRITTEPQLKHRAVNIGKNTVTFAYNPADREIIIHKATAALPLDVGCSIRTRVNGNWPFPLHWTLNPDIRVHRLALPPSFVDGDDVALWIDVPGAGTDTGKWIPVLGTGTPVTP